MDLGSAYVWVPESNDEVVDVVETGIYPVTASFVSIGLSRDRFPSSIIEIEI